MPWVDPTTEPPISYVLYKSEIEAADAARRAEAEKDANVDNVMIVD